jgi:hypothetical protein
MFEEQIREVFDVFVDDGDESFGAVREVGRGRIVRVTSRFR